MPSASATEIGSEINIATIAIKVEPYNIGNNPKTAGSVEPAEAGKPSPLTHWLLVIKPKPNSRNTGVDLKNR